jgi:hypothetical protein
MDGWEFQKRVKGLDMLVVHRFAGGLVAILAGGALETRKVMRNDYALAVAEIVNVFPYLDDLTGYLVTRVYAAELARLRRAIPFHGIAAADAADHHRGKHFIRPNLRDRTFHNTDIVVAEVKARLHRGWNGHA